MANMRTKVIRPASRSSGIADDPERTTNLHLLLMLVCGIAFGFDLAEVGLGPGLSSIFSAPPNVIAPRPLGLLLGASYAGAAIGAPLFGWIARHRGPARSLLDCTLWLAAMSAFSAVSSVPGELTVARFLAGIGLGGYPPLMAALLVDSASPKMRSGLMFGACGIAYLIAPLALFLLRWLTPLHPFGSEGWRVLFAVLALLLIACSVAFRTLPEAPSWLVAVGRSIDAERAEQRYRTSSTPPRFILSLVQSRTGDDVAAEPRSARTLAVVALLLMFALQPIAAIAFPLMTGPMLLARGVSLTDSLSYAAIAALGPAVGAFTIGPLLGRIPRWLSVASCAAAMLFCVVIFTNTSRQSCLAATVLGFGIFSSLLTAALFLFATETFPLLKRTQMTGIAFGLSRVMAAAAPTVLLPLVRVGETPAVIGAIIATLIFMIPLAATARQRA